MALWKREWRALALMTGIAGLLVAFSLVAGSAKAAATTLVVDDDKAQCPSAGYTDISKAIDDANSGDTILVCPGAYPETTVDESVDLVGYTADLSTYMFQCSDEHGFPRSDSAKDSIVAGFVLDADLVTIRGFTLENADYGVRIPTGNNDERITGNVIQHNTFGIYLNGSGSFVDHNCIRSNDRNNTSFTGIYSDQGLKTTTISNNLFFNNNFTPGHLGAAITLVGDGMGNLDSVVVRNNASKNDGDLISIGGSKRSTIEGNTATGADGSGIFLDGGTPANTTLSILNNTLISGHDEGINADVGSLTQSIVSGNTTRGNKTFGIHIGAGNKNNKIRDNNFLNGGSQKDCRDDSAPANSWKNDKGKSATPSNICKK
jgi:parallel beta-helix repeat protein